MSDKPENTLTLPNEEPDICSTSMKHSDSSGRIASVRGIDSLLPIDDLLQSATSFKFARHRSTKVREVKQLLPFEKDCSLVVFTGLVKADSPGFSAFYRPSQRASRCRTQRASCTPGSLLQGKTAPIVRRMASSGMLTRGNAQIGAVSLPRSSTAAATIARTP
jgi:hypothetical protein